MMRALLLVCLLLFVIAVPVSAAPAPADVVISVGFAPPPLPVYVQPVCPAEGYIWTPGYWAYDPEINDYYWVPGTWVLAPEPGFLWTPAYWGWDGGVFLFHAGYWGPHIGFYGGINYGFGYFGHGFEGGHWERDHFFYNRAVTNINVTVVHNVYNTRVSEGETSRVSFHGGSGGIQDRPRPEEDAAARERHSGPIGAQTEHQQAARGNRELRASVNQGKPPIAATARPGDFSGREVVKAKSAGGSYHPESSRAVSESRSAPPSTGAERSPVRAGTAVHAKDLPPIERSTSPSTGDAKLDRKYQQQQEKLQAKQDQDRHNLQAKQEQDHQRQQQQRANEAKQQQLEARHQQQTEQLAQRHAAEQQNLRQRQQPPPVHNASKGPTGGRPPIEKP